MQYISMNIEQNMALAEEVISFTLSGQVLNIRPAIVLPDVYVIETNYSHARRRSLGDNREDENEKNQLTPENFNSITNWQGIRENEASKIVKAEQGHPHYELIKAKMRSTVDQFYEGVANTLPSVYQDYYEDALDDIVADLADCTEARLVMGKNHSFFEKVFEAYQTGGWPCGWEGNYPEGKLVVFVPKS